ncbi:MAG: TrkH family potassium uptake protein [Christensenellaceae bacterium]|nr:TrkH family potassium uptake protein [Christensenellaceae bacterium]
MNRSYVFYILGKLIQVLGVLLLIPMLVGLIFGNSFPVLLSFGVTVLICWLIGGFICRQVPGNKDFYAHEGLVLATLAWFVLPFFGAIPFVLSGEIPNFIDAYFESVSGFTTTGASVLSSTMHALPESLLFWRSFTLLIGGMGMLVFIIYVIPDFGAKGIYIMRAELPGPIFGKVESRVSKSILILYFIYLAMTLILAILIFLGGVPFFESLLLSMGAAATGGFNIHPASIRFYRSPYLEILLSAAMFIFGMSFDFFYLVFIGKIKQVLKSEELKWYAGIVLVATAFITINILPIHRDFWTALKNAFFNVTSVSSTTAYTNTNIVAWPVASQIVLLFLMFAGGMSGSTTSGLKVVRISIFIKSIKQEIRRMISPHRVLPITYDNKQMDISILRSINFYLVTYMGVFFIVLLLVSFDTRSFSQAFNAVISSLSNIGASLDLLGPGGEYVTLSGFSKILLSITMIMGRLEIYPVLILLSRSTWKK